MKSLPAVVVSVVLWIVGFVGMVYFSWYPEQFIIHEVTSPTSGTLHFIQMYDVFVNFALMVVVGCLIINLLRRVFLLNIFYVFLELLTIYVYYYIL